MMSPPGLIMLDRKSTRLNSSHSQISYAVFCLKKKMPIACFRGMFMNKPAGKRTPLVWHHDRWTDLDRDPQITVYTALGPATVPNRSVRILPRSTSRNQPARNRPTLVCHHDRWTALNHDPQITVYTALDPTTVANGCVHILPGSHRRLINPYFFFNVPAPTEIYTLSLHDALPI